MNSTAVTKAVAVGLKDINVNFFTFYFGVERYRYLGSQSQSITPGKTRFGDTPVRISILKYSVSNCGTVSSWRRPLLLIRWNVRSGQSMSYTTICEKPVVAQNIPKNLQKFLSMIHESSNSAGKTCPHRIWTRQLAIPLMPNRYMLNVLSLGKSSHTY